MIQNHFLYQRTLNEHIPVNSTWCALISFIFLPIIVVSFKVATVLLASNRLLATISTAAPTLRNTEVESYCEPHLYQAQLETQAKAPAYWPALRSGSGAIRVKFKDAGSPRMPESKDAGIQLTHSARYLWYHNKAKPRLLLNSSSKTRAPLWRSIINTNTSSERCCVQVTALRREQNTINGKYVLTLRQNSSSSALNFALSVRIASCEHIIVIVSWLYFISTLHASFKRTLHPIVRQDVKVELRRQC